ncbi:putative Fe-S oxidoreductase-like protein [Magnetofaba australis IT-1]|uniref:Putative Fe-S oxidoreductase-like protein n=2 Tax=Magnetofaba TaxID=1472292 RepID=A0A1Y2K0D6_9PROT|nr:putative Fe-S oxidoreductase-like protein [Magnetofaba australis IT-1]
MDKLTREDLYSLEKYAEIRPEFRQQVMAHKKIRVIPVGPNATFHFEDRLTMQYQVQEMLRAERIFEAAGIAEELAVYNPLIPDGANWKVTFMLGYPDIEERRRKLAILHGVETRCWVRVAGFDPVFAIADEDLERDNEEKTSSVHFLRFELTPEMAAAAKAGAGISIGVDHPEYAHQVAPLPEAQRASLAADLD